MTINFNEIVEQRSEATGIAGDRIPFEFGNKTFSFRDPLMLTDDEKDELELIDYDADIAAWYMGDEEYDEFLLTEVEIPAEDGKTIKKTGSSSFFFLVLREHMRTARASDAEGNPTMRNRSSRRAEARKRRKQH